MKEKYIFKMRKKCMIKYVLKEDGNNNLLKEKIKYTCLRLIYNEDATKFDISHYLFRVKGFLVTLRSIA